MKNIKKIKKGIMLATFVVAVFVVSAVGVYAATLNGDSQDYATLRVKNETSNPNSNTGWATTASANGGETVAFAIYYHNTGSDTATNVRVRLTPQITGNSSTQTFNAYVWADNASQVSGGATVSLSSNQSMSFKSGSVIWRPNQTISGSQTLINGQNGSEIFSSNGLLLGDIAKGWNTQGSVVLNFLVDGNGGGNQKPTVTTYSADTVSSNFAVLNGYVNPNGTSNTTRWFEYGTNSGSLTQSTTKLGQGYNASNFSETVSGLTSGTTYYYRAVAQNNASGQVYGNIQSFYTSGYNAGQRPFVTTNNSTNVSQDSATLNGYVNPYNSSNTTRWFEYGTNQNLGSKTNTINHGATSATISDTITGLLSNTTYYYRAVANNSYGNTNGSILSFKTGGTITNNAPVAITNLATNIDKDSARLNGLAIVGNTSVSTNGWFEWGRTQALGNTTITKTLGNVSSMSSYASLFGLLSNTTYYYRFVAQNQNGISRGNILNFRTNSVYVPPVGPKKTKSVSIMKTIENLDSSNGTDTRIKALRGEKIRFTIAIENTGNYELKNVFIKDRIPYYLEFANADKINKNNPQREVVWAVGDMAVGERRNVTLDAIVTDNARTGDIIENTARVESKQLTRNSNIASVQVTDKINSLAAASFFGGIGFLPNTLIGWLLLIILIFALIILSRKLYNKTEEKENGDEAISKK